MTTDIATVESAGLLNVETGELLPATVENAAEALNAARLMKRRLDGVIADATAFLLTESQRVGSKTFQTARDKVVLTGGPMVVYDTTDLMEALREADCPEERISEAVVEEVSYKANRTVLRQLAAANPDYKAAIELAERTLEMPWRVSVK